jgi:hypothetical protein
MRKHASRAGGSASARGWSYRPTPVAPRLGPPLAGSD